MRDYVYDLETYPNVFTAVIACATTKKVWVFEISDRKDDSERLRKFLYYLKDSGSRMVGFNNIGFDYPVLHHFLTTADCDHTLLYNKAMDIINAKDDERFQHTVWESQHIIPQIDLFKIHHFDNQARMTSLKLLEFNMRASNIEDLPYAPGTELTGDQIDVLIKYNKWDVFQTYNFYLESVGMIKFRESVSEKYGMNMMNFNDTKIGKEYFISRLEEEKKGSCYIREGKKKKPRQTWRKQITIRDVILPYIKFNRPEFQSVKDWFERQVIKETKGVFSDILESNLGDLAQYAHMDEKKKKLRTEDWEEHFREYQEAKPGCWHEERLLKSGKISHYVHWKLAPGLNTTVDGFGFHFGTGGIHGSIESTVVYSDEDYIIVDLDVASYYPNIAIKNRLRPAHLGELFCDIYQDIYDLRKTFAKGTDENKAMKLALNGSYGDSNNKHSPLYDPQFTMGITVNGQLMLCMLAESLMEIDGLQMIQINTDGLTVRVPRQYEKLVDKLASKWEHTTMLELEKATYSRMFIRDVNSYIAEYEDGSLKRKGAYEYELEWHKNHSSLVVQKAAEHALVHNGDIEDFIRNHKDEMNFMLRTKVPRSSRLMMMEFDENGDPISGTQIQNTCRYYITEKGYKLVKVMPPIKGKEDKGERHIGIDTDWNVTVCNNMEDYKGGINYDYYISETKKLVDPLIK